MTASNLHSRRTGLPARHVWYRSAFAVGTAILGGFALGCGGETAATTVKEAMYIDSKTQATVVAPASTDTPAVHPVTGERTLMPALYCEKCERWHPAPPLETLQRSPGARKCPNCGTDMTAVGPGLPAAPNPEAG